MYFNESVSTLITMNLSNLSGIHVHLAANVLALPAYAQLLASTQREFWACLLRCRLAKQQGLGLSTSVQSQRIVWRQADPTEVR